MEILTFQSLCYILKRHFLMITESIVSFSKASTDRTVTDVIKFCLLLVITHKGQGDPCACVNQFLLCFSFWTYELLKQLLTTIVRSAS